MIAASASRSPAHRRPPPCRRLTSVVGTTRRNSTHNSPGANHSTKPVMKHSTTHDVDGAAGRDPVPPRTGGVPSGAAVTGPPGGPCPRRRGHGRCRQCRLRLGARHVRIPAARRGDQPADGRRHGARTGEFMTPEGEPRCYVASDRPHRDSYRSLTPEQSSTPPPAQDCSTGTRTAEGSSCTCWAPCPASGSSVPSPSTVRPRRRTGSSASSSLCWTRWGRRAPPPQAPGAPYARRPCGAAIRSRAARSTSWGGARRPAPHRARAGATVTP
ncbi:hypothetical protein GKJPGBOP_07713 [Streptomyces paromomycinus]|uniref:Uncharacterized protein n=1 Tax=Streptomyces paromomycinus TaxID=92743 RepID=A0A401WF81_STREY|nr:hypothetical protein GKJPGBOP_07713 [Streptomyces paromomycinus]